jgi:hypothetical protein
VAKVRATSRKRDRSCHVTIRAKLHLSQGLARGDGDYVQHRIASTEDNDSRIHGWGAIDVVPGLVLPELFPLRSIETIQARVVAPEEQTTGV